MFTASCSSEAVESLSQVRFCATIRVLVAKATGNYDLHACNWPEPPQRATGSRSRVAQAPKLHDATDFIRLRASSTVGCDHVPGRPVVSDLSSLAKKVIAFRDERDWKQFHNPKDVALSLMLEAAEVMEVFQWKEGDSIRETAAGKKAELAEELADVFYYTLLMAHDLQIDLAAALTAKLAKNAEKYPADKARGSNKKYTEL